jgi:hypothetical protein
MRSWSWSALVWTLALAAVGALPARAAGQGVRLGVLMDGARNALEQAWTEDPRQVERAYCVTHWSFGVYHVSRRAPVQDDTVFRVFSVKPAEVLRAGPASADFACPPGSPELHVHTPTTCAGDDLDTCVIGGLNAYSCQPSRGDLEKLTDRGDAFGVVQCDRRAFRFYFASEYVEPGRLSRGPPVGGGPLRSRGSASGTDVREAPPRRVAAPRG